MRDLRREIQGLVGVTLDVNPSEGNALFSGSERVLFGQGAIWDRYGPVGVKLTGHGFSQVNREQAQAMYEAAATFALAPLAEGVLPRSIWELFAGAGALGQVIALRGKERQGLRILGVERDAASVRLAKEAAEAAGLSGCLEFIAQDAGVVMSRLLITLDLGPGAEDSSMRRDGRRPEVVVLDPPRSGCGPELLEALSGARIPRLVYLSCHQGSLARDLHRLVPGGYAVRYVQGFDMMPMTPHLEILAVLEQA